MKQHGLVNLQKWFPEGFPVFIPLWGTKPNVVLGWRVIVFPPCMYVVYGEKRCKTSLTPPVCMRVFIDYVHTHELYQFFFSFFVDSWCPH